MEQPGDRERKGREVRVFTGDGEEGNFSFRYPAQEAFLAVLRREKAEISGFPEGKKRFPEAETGLTEAKTASEQ